MTNPRAAAVEAAALALVNRERARFELLPRHDLNPDATGHIHARDVAEAAVTAYLARMAGPFPRVDDVPAGLTGAEVNVFCRGWNACRAAMLGSKDDA